MSHVLTVGARSADRAAAAFSIPSARRLDLAAPLEEAARPIAEMSKPAPSPAGNCDGGLDE